MVNPKCVLMTQDAMEGSEIQTIPMIAVHLSTYNGGALKPYLLPAFSLETLL